MPRITGSTLGWLLVAALGLSSPRSLAAAVDRWSSAGPDVASVRALAAGGAGVYAGTSEFGVFTSRDGGARWSAVHPAPLTAVEELEVDPGDPGTVYAARTFGGLFRRRDGGAWEYVGPGSPPQSLEAFAVAPSDPQRLYVLSGDRLSVSRDRGASWSEAGNVPGVFVSGANSVRVDPRDPDVVFVGSDSGGGVLKSIDAGRTWSFSRGEGGTRGPAFVVALAIDPRRPDVQYAGSQGEGIWKSADGGEVWRRVLAFPGFGDVPVALAVDPGETRRVYAAVLRFVSSGVADDLPPRGEIWRSADGGATWRRLFAASVPVLSLAIDPRDPRLVYAGLDRRGVFKSTDRGATWRPMRRGLRAYTVLDVTVDPERPGTVWLAAPAQSSYRYGFLASDYVHPGIFRSQDGGRSWVARDAGIVDRPVELLAIDPARPERLLAYGTAGSFRTADGGASWQPIAALTQQGLTLTALAIDPSDPDRIYAAGSRRELIGDSAVDVPVVWRSLDGGASWTELDGGFDLGREGLAREGQVHGLLVHPARTQTVYAGATTGFFRSRDGGDRWVRLGAGLLASCIDGAIALNPFTAGTLYALACDPTRLVYKSTDFGAHWAPTPLVHDGSVTDVEALRADPHRRGSVYAGGSKGLFATENRGASWRRFEAGLPPAARWVRSLAADPHAPGRLYAGLQGGGLFTILRSE